MLSASTNTRYPAFSRRPNDRHLTKGVANQLDTKDVRLWSFQEPPLTVGSYSLGVSQSLQEDEKANAYPLSLPDKKLKVSAPKFRLADPSDVHSVYPAAGQSGYCQTLAHVVFTHPTIPWEREIQTSLVGFNRQPWVAVLSFTEGELILNAQTAKDIGFVRENEKLSAHGTVSAKAADLVAYDFISSPLRKVDDAQRDYDLTDDVNTLLLTNELFERLFSGSSEGGQPKWLGTADVSKFAYMAHVRETHGGFMASTNPANAQPQFSVVVSPRTGPPGTTKPTRVVSHLISLEGLPGIDLTSKPRSKHVGLVSLLSWDWMCVPPDHVDFGDVMRSLGHSVQPLRVSDKDLRTFEEEGNKGETKDASAWLHGKLHAGYTLKPHTLRTGEQTTSLLRGPFLPVAPKRDMVKPFVMHWAALELTDGPTGLADVSYSSAWSLGRGLALADSTLTASLLRLRAKVHAAATKLVKSKALGSQRLDKQAYFDTLEASVHKLVAAHSIDGLSERGATARWLRTETQRKLPPAQQLSQVRYSASGYMDAVEAAMAACFGLPPEKDGGGSAPAPAPAPDSDASVVRAWALDKLYLSSIPLHHLVPDPDMLPRESIRTFCLDSQWVESVIDGGLSLGNHHAGDDDAIRREIKRCLNRYLAEVASDGPGKGTTLQVPRWGFLLRSIAVSAFPDLKVEARLRDDTPGGLREVLYMQLLADDILLCLFDRVPGEENFEEIAISQPQHQQTFELGTALEPDSFTTWFRPIPRIPGSELAKTANISKTFPRDRSGKVDLYDWASRLLRPEVFLRQYLTEMELSAEKDKIFQWANKEGAPASVLASQLSSPILTLKLPVQQEPPPAPGGKIEDQNDNRPRYTKPGTQLYVRERPADNSEPPKTSNGQTGPSPRPDPDFASLPTGPRPPVSTPSLPPHDSQPIVPGELGHLVERMAPKAAATFQTYPLRAACSPIYDPGNISGNIYALDRPLDLVFSLKYVEDSSTYRVYPRELQVRIPVSFGSDDNNASNPPLLRLRGTPAAPVLPKVEGLNPSALFSYSVRLAVGNMYPLSEPSPPVGTVLELLPTDVLLLIVTIRPRFSRGKMQSYLFDGSFLLRQVQAVLPEAKDGSRPVQVDIWNDSNEGGKQTTTTTTYVQPKRIYVRRATTVTIAEPTFYSLDQAKLFLAAKVSSPLLESQGLATRIQGPSGDEVTVAVPLDQQPGGDGSIIGTAAIDRGNAPKLVRFGVVNKSTMERNGPELDICVIPDLPKPFQVRLYWHEDGLHLSWDPLLTNSIYTLRFLFQVLDPNGAPIESTSLWVDVTQNTARYPEKQLADAQVLQGQTLKIQHQLHLVDNARVRGVAWQQTLLFNVLRTTTSALQFNIGAAEALLPDSTLQAFTTSGIGGELLSLCYVSASRIPWRLGFRANSTEIVQGPLAAQTPSVLASGELMVYRLNDSYLEVWWIDEAGRIENLWSANVNDPSFTRQSHGSWETYGLGWPRMASTYGGGALTAATNVQSRGSSVLWLVEPNGLIVRARWMGDIDRWAPALTYDAAGKVALTGRRPSRPQAWFVPIQHPQACSDVMWIEPNGQLKMARLWFDVPYGQAPHDYLIRKVAVPDADASVNSGLCVHPTPFQAAKDGLIQFAFWVSRDGGVWGAHSLPVVDMDHMAWTKFPIAPAGSAHLATSLCAFEQAQSTPGTVLLWFDGGGRLQYAKWRNAEPFDLTFWSPGFFSPAVTTPVDGKLELSVIRWGENSETQLFWVGPANRLQTIVLGI